MSDNNNRYSRNTGQLGPNTPQRAPQSRYQQSQGGSYQKGAGGQFNMGNITNPYDYNNTGSYFDGTVLQFVGWYFLTCLITSFTFGIAGPWAFVLFYKWEVKHTVVNGRRLEFYGKGGDLFLRWLLWLFLTIITLGIYSFWVYVKMQRWKIAHTRFMQPGSTEVF